MLMLQAFADWLLSQRGLRACGFDLETLCKNVYGCDFATLRPLIEENESAILRHAIERNLV